MTYQTTQGLQPPATRRPTKRQSLDDLVMLANGMEINEAALLTLSEAQTFRVILAAQGFNCVTDGYRSPPGRRIWCFKITR